MRRIAPGQTHGGATPSEKNKDVRAYLSTKKEDEEVKIE